MVKKKKHKRWKGFRWEYLSDEAVVCEETLLCPWIDWKNSKDFVKVKAKRKK